MRSTVSLGFAFGIVGLIGPRVLGQTDVGGLICKDTMWDVGGSPYVVSESIIVGCDATLTIAPAVVVRFNSDLGIVMGSVFGPGTMIARGTEEFKIVFQSNLEPQAPGGWAGVRFSDLAVDAEFDVADNYQSGSIMEYIIVESAGAGLPAVLIENSRPYLARCEIRDSTNGGISIDGTDAPPQLIEDCEIHHSGASNQDGGGIWLAGGSGHRLRGNHIHDCVADNGGGLYIDAQTRLEQNTVDQNSANGFDGDAGGIFMGPSSDGTTMTGNRIIANNAGRHGGGLSFSFSDGNTLTGNTITDNSAPGGSGGGVFFNNSDGTTLTGNTITGNSSNFLGGGICFLSSSNSTLTDNTINANTGSDGGGAFFGFGGGSTLERNTITGNAAAFNGGGASFSSNGDNRLIDNTVTGNSADREGGGLSFNFSGSNTLAGNTIDGNTCDGEGGAIKFRVSGNSTVSNTQVTRNHTTSGETGGIYVLDSPGVSLEGDQALGIFNRIYGNDGYAVTNENDFDATGANDTGASYVWWGTCDIDAIEEQIFDFFDRFPNAFVLFLPVVDPGGDSEFDGDVDLDDFAVFSAGCLTGPCGPVCVSPPTSECEVFDFDCDGDIDLRDHAEFAKLFTGTIK